MNRAVQYAGAMIALAAMAIPAWAAPIAWDGGGGTNTNWNLGTNWAGDSVPTAGDDATIGSGVATMNATLGCDSVTISGGTVYIAHPTTYNPADIPGTSVNDNLTMTGGALAYNGGGAYATYMTGNIELQADTTFNLGAGNINKSVNLTGSITQDATPRQFTYTGTSDTTVNLSGSSSYSGGTILAGPTGGGTSVIQIAVSNSGALGTGPVQIGNRSVLRFRSANGPTCGTITLLAGGQLAIEFTGTGSYPVTAVDPATYNLQGGRVNGANNVYGGTRWQGATVTVSNTVEFAALGGTRSFYINSAIGGTGQVAIASCASDVIYEAANNYAGGTEIRPGGRLVVNSGATLPGSIVEVQSKGKLTIKSGSTIASTIDLVLAGNDGSGNFGQVDLQQNIIVNTLTVSGAIVPIGTYVEGDAAIGGTSNWVGTMNGNTVQVLSVPEPATIGLLGLGFAGLAVLRRRRK